MWLNVASSNNDPAIVASYYLSCVDQVKGIEAIMLQFTIFLYNYLLYVYTDSQWYISPSTFY